MGRPFSAGARDDIEQVFVTSTRVPRVGLGLARAARHHCPGMGGRGLRRAAGVALAIVALASTSLRWDAPSTPHAGAAIAGIHKIQHVIVIVQENRSFDSYFGTFPGADGIPMANGEPTACVPNPKAGGCT